MSWFLAAAFIGCAAVIVITQEAAPWWWCALMCLVVAGREVEDALKKRRG